MEIQILCNRRGCKSLKLKHSKLCEKCYLKQKSVQHLKTVNYWKELKEILIQQNYICPYTGDNLILGLNTSLDHIISKKNDNSKSLDINNVQWVTFEVNMAKSHMLHQDFIIFCQKVVNYNKKTL